MSVTLDLNFADMIMEIPMNITRFIIYYMENVKYPKFNIEIVIADSRIPT